MTTYRNKQYNLLKSIYEQDIVNKDWYHNGKYDWDVSHFMRDAMELIEEYHIVDIQYKARIKTLKEIIKEFNKKV